MPYSSVKYNRGFTLIELMITIAIFSIIMVIFLEFARQGRYTYAVGGNPEAATHVGININKIKRNAFLIIGVCTGVSGIVMASMFGAGNPTMGEGFLMPAIIACFLGAVFLKDGLPNTRGTLVSCFLLAILENGFVMTNVPLFLKEVTQGAVLIVALLGIGLLRAKK